MSKQPFETPRRPGAPPPSWLRSQRSRPPIPTSHQRRPPKVEEVGAVAGGRYTLEVAYAPGYRPSLVLRLSGVAMNSRPFVSYWTREEVDSLLALVMQARARISDPESEP
jgi:hypothetical protein